MLRDIYAPSDFKSLDGNPDIPVDEKLKIIAASHVQIKHTVTGGEVRANSFATTLPFIDGALFNIGARKFPETIFSEHINVGDAELYRNGIGTRLMMGAFRYAVAYDPLIREFHTGWARLGLVNATVSVLGEDNVGVHIDGKRYGWGSELPLETMFDDQPAIEGKPYLVNGIVARIDHDLAMSWDEPEVVAPSLLPL